MSSLYLNNHSAFHRSVLSSANLQVAGKLVVIIPISLAPVLPQAALKIKLVVALKCSHFRGSEQYLAATGMLHSTDGKAEGTIWLKIPGKALTLLEEPWAL